MSDLAQVWLAAFGLAAIFFTQRESARLQRWAPVCGLVAQPAWFYATWTTDQIGIFILSIVYTLLWLDGLYRKWIKR